MQDTKVLGFGSMDLPGRQVAEQNGQPGFLPASIKTAILLGGHEKDSPEIADTIASGGPRVLPGAFFGFNRTLFWFFFKHKDRK